VTLTIELDTKPFEAAISKYADEKLPMAIDRGLFKWGERTMGRIKGSPDVPVMDGQLRSTGVVLPVERNGTLHTLTLGFGGPAAPYAVKTHENPRAGKTGGISPQGRRYKKWAKVGAYKFLEGPMAQDGPKIPDSIAAEAR
jgi:hypothetical protein